MASAPNRVFSTELTEKHLWLLVLVLTATGCLLRILGALNDVWLDELISIHNAFLLRSPVQVFTALHSDNNHYLNTLYLYLVGPQRYWPVYRYFSIACGVLSVPAAYWAARVHSKAVALTYAVIVAFSYPLIHYSSEARGYSAVMLACILAYGSLSRWISAPATERTKWTLCYAASTMFGLLAHLTFLPILFALALWSLVAVWRSPSRSFSAWLMLHLPAALLLILLGWFDLRFLRFLGSGLERPGWELLSRLVALSIGWPYRDYLSVWLVAVPLTILMFAALYSLYRSGDRSWILLGFALVFPALFFSLPLHMVSLRYLIVFVPFWFLLFAIAIQVGGRPLQWTALSLFLIGNMFLYSHFLVEGRGHFSAAMMFMDRHTTSPVIAINSDQDFRAGIELDFYQRLLPPGRVHFVPNGQYTSERAEWAIFHRDALDPALLDSFQWGNSVAYKVATFRCSELSGQVWTIYHLTYSPEPVPTPAR